MTRYEIKEGAIKIAYGSEHATGYFLMVQDERLAWSRTVSQECNEFRMEHCVDGGGSYLSLYTGPLGIGEKVSKELMVEFLKLYGAPEKHWKLVKEGRGM